MSLAFIDQNAARVMQPLRLQILDHLRDPGSASTVARTLGLPRQKVNYHLRELEKAGLIEEVEQRRNGNCMERIVRATATHFLVHPELLGDLAADPSSISDRFSASYLIALAAETIRDVADAQAKAEKARKRVATFTLQTDVRFTSAETRGAFVTELSNTVARLVAKYNDEQTAGGRSFRFTIAGYPTRRKGKESR